MKEYDYVILGGGMGGLAIGSLLAKTGKSVCLIEANSKIGGHAYTMKVGKYQFCHDVQYLMGCQNGGPMHKFLKMLNLDEKVKFNKMDSKKFDLINIKGKIIEVPHGLRHYEEELIKIYPEHKKELSKYFSISKKIFQESRGYEKVLNFWDVLKNPFRYLTIIRYINYTLEDVFNKFNFPIEIRAILSGRIGNLSGRPNEISFIMYVAMDNAYCESAHFPQKGMGFMINSILDIINSKNNCRVMLNSKVDNIYLNKNKVEYVKTNNEKIYGNNFISNLDSHLTTKLIKTDSKYMNKKNNKLSEKTNYKYSDSVFWIYLGLKDVNLFEKGFTKSNIWHNSLLNINKEYGDEIKKDDFTHPFIFISVPSLLAKEGELCPKNCHTMEIATTANYNHFKKLYDTNLKKYEKTKLDVYEILISIIEKNYFSDIRKYIDSVTIHTPVDMEKILNIPKGNIYGCRLTPKNYNINRITCTQTFFNNLNFIGASASFPGIMGVIVGAMDLFKKLNKKF